MNRFRFSNDDIMSDIYVPSETSKPKLALFLYGFPATIGENPMTEFLVEKGYFVIQPHYPGTYDSGGEFTPQNVEGMVSTLLEYLSKGTVINLKDNSPVHIPQNVTLCVGYSFGCLITLRCLPSFKYLNTMVLVSPAITYGKATIPSGFKESGLTFLEYVRRSRPYTYRLGNDKEWEKLYAGGLNVPSGNAPTTLKKIVGIAGAKDNSFDIPTLKKNFKPIIEQYVGDEKSIDLQILSNGGHSVDSLVNQTTRVYLEKVL